MAHTRTGDGPPAGYRGEVWTDGRGRAVVALPPETAALTPPLDYAVQPLDVAVTAAVTSELTQGRFTIETDQPHVKVAWRITGATCTSNQGEAR
jgi:hypothetical protein